MDLVGGIVGDAEKAVIRNVSYSGTVAGMYEVGGIVGGAKGGSIQNAWNAGTAKGDSTVGGIVGKAKEGSTFQNVCNTGAITGNENVGGIVGGINDNSTLQNAWNTGAVTGNQKSGGIVGFANGGSIRHAVSKAGSAGQTVGTLSGGADVTDVKVAPEADMKLAATYMSWQDANGKALVATEGGKGTPWRIYDGKTMPLLTGLMKGTKRLAKVYDGNVFATTDPHITLVHTGKDVGTYDAYSDQFGYDLIGGATITQRVLTMSGVAAQSKTYDGTTSADTSKFQATLGNVVAGEESSVTATATGATYNDKNVAGANKVTYTGVQLTGAGAGNYSIASTVQGEGSITPKQLNLALTSGARFDKTYDGNANVTQALAKGTNYTLTGFVGTEGDHLALAAATGTYTDKNAATDKAVTFGGLTLTGTGADNYMLGKTTLTGIGTIAPRALTLGAVTAQTKTYDGNTSADALKFHAALNNVVAGEENLVKATATGAAYNDKNVAAANTVSYTGVALAGAEAGNYTLAATTAQGAGTISRRALTVDTVAAQTKTYDGNTAADTSKFRATLGNFVAGEEGSATATAAGASYNDKNVARAATVTYTGLSLRGTGAGNYSIASTAQGTGTISQRALTLGAVESQSKTYDGTTAADASKFRATLGNAVAGDNVTAAATTATFNDKNVAAANRIDYTGVGLAGADAGNYSLAATTAQGDGTITKRTLTVGTVAAQSKTYDGTTAADTSKFRATLGNLVAGEEGSVTATAGGATYNDKNVAAANKVSYTGLALQGTGAGNYSIASTVQGEGSITPKQLNLALTSGARFDKTYDGNANVTQALAKGTNYTLTGFIGTEGDHLALAATGTYTDKNAATDKAVTFGGLTLTGTGAGNYTLDKTTLTGTGTISRRALTLGAVGAQTKTYDGTTDADTSKFGAVLNNVVAGDNVTAAAAGAAYNDKNVAAANTVNYTGVQLTGTGAGNYTLAATTAQGAGSITRRALTLGAVAAQTKTYDGTTSADTSKFQATLGNLVAGEESSVTATATGATYNDKNVAAANKVIYTGLALTGAGVGNYSIVGSAEGQGRIAPKELTLDSVGSMRFDKTYDGNANVTQALAKGTNYTLTGFITGEGNGITLGSSTGTYSDKNAAADKTVTFGGLMLTGTGAGNYALDKTSLTGTGTISRRALTLGTVAAQTKTYDGNTSADASKFRAALNNAVAGDNVTAAAATATFNDKNVAAANRIDYTGVALRGADAGNYTLAATTAEGTGAITRCTLTVGTVAAQSKTYDGNTAADTSKFRATLGNFVAGEEGSATATAAGASYNDKNVAAANKVNYTGVALTGTGAANYTVADTAQGTGTITRRALTIGTVTAQTKTYDGTTSADASQFHAGLNNVVAGEESSVTATAAGAAYNDKNVARATSVGYTGVALTGTGAANYAIADTAQGTGTISRRALTLGTVAAQTKTYDGNTSADASKFRAALNNAVAGDNVTAAAATATFNDKNVAAANRIDYTGVALRGADAGNYTLAATTAEGTGAITRCTLTVGTVAAQSKTYDGTTAADTSKFRATLDNVVAGEEGSVTATAAGATYNDKNVAGANAVGYTGVALTGTGAGNYAIADTAQGAGTITKRALTLGEVAAQTKTYDGTTAADTSKFRAALAGTIAGDNVTAAAAGAAYNDKNVARANRIDYTGIALRGADAGNYSIAATTAQGAGTITHRTLTLAATAQSVIQGEPMPAFTGRADGFADGEDERVFGTDSLTFDTTATNTDTLGSYGVTGRIGSTSDGVLGNYRIGQAAGNATAFTVNAMPTTGGILAALVQDAAPRFDFGFGDIVYLYGTPRPIPTATLGIYRFDAERAFEIQGLSL